MTTLPQKEMDLYVLGSVKTKGVDGSHREPKGVEEGIHALEACKQHFCRRLKGVTT
jgi:hypothetical protein